MKKAVLLFVVVACTVACFGQSGNKGNGGDYSFEELASILEKECFVKWECPEGFSIGEASKEINADLLNMWKRPNNKLQASPYNIYSMSLSQEAVADNGNVVIQYPSHYIFTLMPYALAKKGQYPGVAQLADSIASNVFCTSTKEIVADRFGCNADTIVVSKMKLDKPVAGRYSHCVMVFTAKKDGLPLYFRILANEKNYQSIDKTIDNLLRHVVYKEGCLPSYFYQESETAIYREFAKAMKKDIANSAPTECVELEKAGDKTSFALVTDISYEESKQRWCIGLLPSARPHYISASNHSKTAMDLIQYAISKQTELKSDKD